MGMKPSSSPVSCFTNIGVKMNLIALSPILITLNALPEVQKKMLKRFCKNKMGKILKAIRKQNSYTYNIYLFPPSVSF